MFSTRFPGKSLVVTLDPARWFALKRWLSSHSLFTGELTSSITWWFSDPRGWMLNLVSHCVWLPFGFWKMSPWTLFIEACSVPVRRFTKPNVQFGTLFFMAAPFKFTIFQEFFANFWMFIRALFSPKSKLTFAIPELRTDLSWFLGLCLGSVTIAHTVSSCQLADRWQDLFFWAVSLWITTQNFSPVSTYFRSAWKATAI